MKHLRNIILVLFILLLIDLPIIGYLNRNLYISQFKSINKRDLKMNNSMLLSGCLAYILMSVGLYKFVIYPSLKWKLTLNEIITRSLLLGLVIYGIYNFTNKATIYNYNYYTVIIDTIWGSILFTITALLSIMIIKKLKK
jgi:uncharacterized membrane protein